MKGWKKTVLGNVIELKRGYDLPKQSRIPGNVPLVSSSGVSDTHVEAKVKGPGVVTGRYGTIGEVFWVEEDFWPLNTTLYVRSFKGNDPRFISYFLRTIDFSTYSDKAAVPGINRNHLHLAEVVVPPIQEQKRIADILSSLDEKIELNRQMNKTLEAMAQAIFKSWFVDFDPVKAKAEAKAAGLSAEAIERAAMAAIAGKTEAELDQLSESQQQSLSQTAALFPNSFQNSELGEIPSGWEVSTIGSETETVGGGTPDTKNPDFWENGQYHWVTPRDFSSLQDKVLLSTSRKITEEGLAKIGSGLLPTGTVLISSRAPVGYLAISKIETAINQGFIAMKCTGRLSSEYVLQWATSEMDNIKQAASGSTFAEISKKTFRPFCILVPTTGILEAFTDLASKLYEQIAINGRQSETLAILRDTLLPKLLLGEIEIGGQENE